MDTANRHLLLGRLTGLDLLAQIVAGTGKPAAKAITSNRPSGRRRADRRGDRDGRKPRLASGTRMTKPIWVPLAAVVAIHDRQIARHGGAADTVLCY